MSELERLPPVNTLFSVRFVVSFGVVAALAVIGATIWYAYSSDAMRSTLVFFAAACAAAGTIGLSLYTTRILQFTVNNQTAATRDMAAKEARLEKQWLEDAAARFGERWTDASMFYLRKECRELIESRTDPDGLLKTLQNDKNKPVNVGNILNFLEELSLSVNKGRCSEEIAKSLFCGIVINIWHATEPWVRQQRTNRGRPQLWAELEILYGRWR
jgi:hypothetical protein